MRAHAQTTAHAATETSVPRGGLLQRKCACGGAGKASEGCESCAGKKLTLQRRAAGPAAPAVPPIVHEVLGSAGRPLDAGTRSFMESRFGHDFSHVRVHTDGRAAASARAVNALAYTVGRDIVFAEGQYSPASPSGQRLLAHEMTHVLQQSAGGGPSRIQFAGRESDRYEAEADSVADRVTSMAPRPLGASTISRLAHSAPVSLMRQPAPPSQVCDTPNGPGPEQQDVSQKLYDRMMGKYASIDQDTGEGCREQPYVAGIQESVCTIGFGHQITEMDCPILRRDTNQPLTAKEKTTKKFDPPWQSSAPKPEGGETKPDQPAAGEAKADQPKADQPKADPAPAAPPPAPKEEGKKEEGKKDAAPPAPSGGKKKQAGPAKPKPQEDPNAITVAKLRCGCEGKISYSCTGEAAKKKLRDDVQGVIPWVKERVHVSTNQEQFDALVDITLHRGSIPPDLLDAINKYWCTNRGKNYVRELYLKAALTREHSDVIEPNFVHRRQVRVWSPLPEEPETPAPPPEKKKAAPPPKKAEPQPQPTGKPPALFPEGQAPPPPSSIPDLSPPQPQPSPFLTPQQPSPVKKAAGEVEYAQGWARRLLQQGKSLRARLDADRPSAAELKAFADEVDLWHKAIATNLERYPKEGREEAATALRELRDRFAPKLAELRTHLGV